MAAPVLGRLVDILSRGGLSRALSVVRGARISRVSVLPSLQEIFVDITRREASALFNLAEQSVRAAQRANAGALTDLLFDHSPACHGIGFTGSLAGAIGRAGVTVSNPLGGEDQFIEVTFGLGDTKEDIMRRAIEVTSERIHNYRERLAPDITQQFTLDDIAGELAAAADFRIDFLECTRNP